MPADNKPNQRQPEYLPAGQAATDAILRLARLAAEGMPFDWVHIVSDLRDEWSAADLLRIEELAERMGRVAREAPVGQDRVEY